MNILFLSLLFSVAKAFYNNIMLYEQVENYDARWKSKTDETDDEKDGA